MTLERAKRLRELGRWRTSRTPVLDRARGAAVVQRCRDLPDMAPYLLGGDPGLVPRPVFKLCSGRPKPDTKATTPSGRVLSEFQAREPPSTQHGER
jgi:hypothetical protein